jgi:hypothetical protein
MADRVDRNRWGLLSSEVSDAAVVQPLDCRLSFGAGVRVGVVVVLGSD